MIEFCLSDPQTLPPRRATSQSAGVDLFMPESVTILPTEKCAIDLGIVVKLPIGTVGLLTLRSSAAKAHRIDCHLGVIGKLRTLRTQKKEEENTHAFIPDSDYRGSLQALVTSRENKTLLLEKGTSWFQLLTVQSHLSQLTEVEEISADSERGVGGFGSTGFVGTQPPATSTKRTQSAASPTDGSNPVGDYELRSKKTKADSPPPEPADPVPRPTAAVAGQPRNEEDEVAGNVAAPDDSSSQAPE